MHIRLSDDVESQEPQERYHAHGYHCPYYQVASDFIQVFGSPGEVVVVEDVGSTEIRAHVHHLHKCPIADEEACCERDVHWHPAGA